MKKSILVLIANLIVISYFGNPFAAEVSISSNEKRILSTDVFEIHKTKCGKLEYVLTIDKFNKKISFESNLMPRKSVDITGEGFSNFILDKKTFGKMEISCRDESSVSILFVGFSVKNNFSAFPVSYFISLQNDGHIVADSGIREEKISYISTQPMH